MRTWRRFGPRPSRATRRSIEPHFLVEERWLLPALDRVGEGALADRTRAEHADLRRLLTAAVNGDHDTLRAFASMLEHHVRFEERTLFEVAQQKLALADWPLRR